MPGSQEAPTMSEQHKRDSRILADAIALRCSGYAQVESVALGFDGDLFLACLSMTWMRSCGRKG